ncbi:MAG: hypothetical protein KJI71_03945 [Patescibacteria group bacterium]|nr:hypothetical protein [Patescibacteria group bacterium]
MQIFEFHFNPKSKPDLIFDSFCYEPENIYEKKMGSLYIIGLLRKALPQNVRLIENLAREIKDKYYRSTVFTPEKSLKESLKLANEFLDKMREKGDIGWLGNLDFTILSLKDFKLNFAKLGDIKILLIRGGTIIDIDKKINLEDIEPYPLKVFSNTVSGKLAKDDLILVLTKDIFDLFQQQNLLKEFAKLSPFSDKGLKKILNGKRENLVKTSGILLAITLTEKVLESKKETVLVKELKEFSLKKIFTPVLNLFKKAKAVSAPKLAIGKNLRFPQITIPKIKPLFLNKKINLVFYLIILLAFGFLFSQYEQGQKMKIHQAGLERIQEKLNLAESFLIIKETNPQGFQKANLLLKESWNEISSLSKEVIALPKSFSNQVFVLKDKILEKLSELNKLEKVESPELFFKFDQKVFVPHRILAVDNNLYFFSPYSKDIFYLKENGEKEIIQTGKSINLATKLNDSIVFFSKPDQLMVINEDDTLQRSLQDSGFDFNDLSSFKKSLYFLDKKAAQIIKYPYLGNLKWGSPQLWLYKNTQKPTKADSFSVDGSVWMLRENSIHKYYGGEFQREFTFEVFPEPKEFSKIYTSPLLPYFYILEPVQKRLIVLNRDGEIIKQFQSEEFDNLLDFGVSNDGKTIYLLNALKVYRIQLNS